MDNLIERLERISAEFIEFHDRPDVESVGIEFDLLGEIIAALRAQRWISVEDELPKDRALVYSPLGDEAMKYRILPPGFAHLATDATHWMPLPTPSETE